MKILSDDVFIYPTDTVWGIGCSIYSEKGYERIAEIKRTNKNKPLSIMFADPEDVRASFKLPEEVSRPWLKKFFELETTLGLPLSSALIRIPKWATGESSYVSIRCLCTPAVEAIHQQIQVPFFSTSLNLTGEPPVTNIQDAKKFQAEHAADVLFIEGSQSALSGTSSTIVFVTENLNFDIKREGRKGQEVKEHLMKLFC